MNYLSSTPLGHCLLLPAHHDHGHQIFSPVEVPAKAESRLMARSLVFNKPLKKFYNTSCCVCLAKSVRRRHTYYHTDRLPSQKVPVRPRAAGRLTRLVVEAPTGLQKMLRGLRSTRCYRSYL